MVYMIKKEKMLNYFLSIGFILFLTIFLSLIVIMSRFVLSGVTPIGAHVQYTQTLLEDIEQVQKAATLNIADISNSTISRTIVHDSYSSFNELDVNISQVSYFNSEEDNSVISITFDGKIGLSDGVYYLEKFVDDLDKGDFVAFKVNGILKTGKFLILNNDLIHILSDDEILKINTNQLLGKIFYIESDEKN